MNPDSRKLRILLVNKFYRHDGGDCVHFLALEKLLRENDHEVAVMAMEHPCNLPLSADSFEVSQVRIDGPFSKKLKAVARIMGLAGVRKTVREAISAFNPDIVHLHNIHSYLSPAVAEEAHRAGVAVVWTLHDYKLICGSYSCLRNGAPCVECLSDSTAILRHRCMKNSFISSAVAYAEANKWNRKKLCNMADLFICPSEFMRGKMIQGGIPENSLIAMHNFAPAEISDYCTTERKGVCYIGRLSPEKGLENLLDAAVAGGWNLTVAGDGELKDNLTARYDLHENISFVGRLNGQQVSELLARSQLSVMPSVCYENNPLAVIESLTHGTPVAASDIGGLPELINDSNGALFEPGNPAAINETVKRLLNTSFNHDVISNEALRKFSPEEYLTKLVSIYSSLL